VPIGRPIANTQLYVLTEDLRQAPPGQAGELYIGGVQLARGYYRRPGLTAGRFIPDPSGSGRRLYRTGDIVRWRPDGELEYLGRVDDQVKINGFRIEPDEIAVALRAHPQLRDAVVVPRTGITGSQQLVAYVVAEAGPERCPPPAELRQFLGRTLPLYMLPAIFMPLAKIPLSLNGKIDRKQLPAPDLTRQEKADLAPRTTTDTDDDPTDGVTGADSSILDAVCRIWAEVLGLPTVMPEDNFLELGGDSICAMKVVAQCQQLGLPVTSRSILLAEDVAELVESVQPALRASYESL